MRRRSKWLLVLIAMSCVQAHAQDSTLTYADFLDLVMQNHPEVYQADIRSEQGAATVRQAKGGFDPVIGGDVKQKYFDDKMYYSQMNGHLKVPTRTGLSFEMGYDNSGGVYLNPSDRLPENGLWYAGVNLELGSGLLIDQRRAALRKAGLYQEATEIERSWMRNELIYKATVAYWKWSQAYEWLKVLDTSVVTAAARLEAVKSYVAFGDRPEITITEAAIQYQNRLLDLEQAQLQWLNAERELELYLWNEGTTPLEINGAVPEALSRVQIDVPMMVPNALDSLLIAHPLVNLGNLQIQQNEVDLQLKKEYLKPKLTLKYRALNEPVVTGFFSEYNIANYTWGASVSYPIFTRRERADVALSELKIESQQLKQNTLQAKIGYEIETSMNAIRTYQAQLELTQKNVEDYQTLLAAEIQLFDNGESSIFMVNSRELKYLEASLKQLQIQMKLAYEQAGLKLQLFLLDENQ